MPSFKRPRFALDAPSPRCVSPKKFCTRPLPDFILNHDRPVAQCHFFDQLAHDWDVLANLKNITNPTDRTEEAKTQTEDNTLTLRFVPFAALCEEIVDQASSSQITMEDSAIVALQYAAEALMTDLFSEMACFAAYAHKHPKRSPNEKDVGLAKLVLFKSGKGCTVDCAEHRFDAKQRVLDVLYQTCEMFPMDLVKLVGDYLSDAKIQDSQIHHFLATIATNNSS